MGLEKSGRGGIRNSRCRNLCRACKCVQSVGWEQIRRGGSPQFLSLGRTRLDRTRLGRTRLGRSRLVLVRNLGSKLRNGLQSQLIWGCEGDFARGVGAIFGTQRLQQQSRASRRSGAGLESRLERGAERTSTGVGKISGDAKRLGELGLESSTGSHPWNRVGRFRGLRHSSRAWRQSQ